MIRLSDIVTRKNHSLFRFYNNFKVIYFASKVYMTQNINPFY